MKKIIGWEYVDTTTGISPFTTTERVINDKLSDSEGLGTLEYMQNQINVLANILSVIIDQLPEATKIINLYSTKALKAVYSD